MDFDAVYSQTDEPSVTGINPNSAPGTPDEYLYYMDRESGTRTRVQEIRVRNRVEAERILKEFGDEIEEVIFKVIPKEIKVVHKNDVPTDAPTVTLSTPVDKQTPKTVLSEPSGLVFKDSNYPKGIIEYPVKGAQPRLRIYDPKPEYPFEDFELKIIHEFDDGHKEESNHLVCGWRGSIKKYVKIVDDDHETYVDGFKQHVFDRNGNKVSPSINVGVKYHTKDGNLVIPVFGLYGDERVQINDFIELID